jgi:adenylosuccinate synthase
MPKKIVLLSGPICSGKTTLLAQLGKVFECSVFKTSKVLREKKNRPYATRGELQIYGEYLDRKTKGKWIIGYLADFVKNLLSEDDHIVVVDSVRAESQIDEIRAAYGPSVFHFHLTAPREVLEQRYSNLIHENAAYEFASFAESQRNKTERNIDKLGKFADVLINTVRCTENDLLIKAACHLGLYCREHERVVDVLVGGQYGSEGKGNIASYLAKDYDYLIRVGGPNAGHKVFLSPPYTFHQLPSGTRHSSAQLIIGPGAVINPQVILKEISECGVNCGRLTIDPQAMIISKQDIKNELGLKKDISSTQSGSGYALARKITHRGKKDVILAKDVADFKPFIKDTLEVLDRAFLKGQKILVEGTQGTALSLYHGFYPYVTSRDTTVAGCLAETGISPNRVRKVIMVCRTYPIRVQNPEEEGRTSGRMNQEITLKDIAERSGLDIEELERTEITSTTKRKRRIGEFEWDLLRKSSSLNAPTDIALTFVDYLDARNREARRFDQLTDETIRFIEEVERVAFAPVTLISTRFHHRSIIDRRNWR